MLIQSNSNVAYIIYFERIGAVPDIVPHHEETNFNQISYRYSYSFDNSAWSEWFEDGAELVSHLNVNPSNLGNIYIKAEIKASKGYDLSFASYKLLCIQVDGKDLIASNMTFATKTDILTRTNSKNLYRPYRDTSKALQLQKTLARGVSDIFSHECTYFRTEAIEEERLTTFKTFPLTNVVENKQLNIMIDGNKLPDSRYAYSEYDYDFQDELEIHIVIEVWRELFGDVEPNANDYLFLPLTNRMYQINTVHDHKSFMHKAVYYRAMLVEYEDRADVIKTEDITKELESYVDYIDSFDEDRLEDELADAVKTELHTPTEIDETTRISKSEETPAVAFMYNWAETNNDIAAHAYNIVQTGDEFGLALWFEANKLSRPTANTETILSAVDKDNNRTFRLAITNNSEITAEFEGQPNARHKTKLPVNELTAGQLYGVCVNYAYSATGQFVTITVIDSKFNVLNETLDQQLPFGITKSVKVELRGGFKLGNIRMKKQIINRSQISTVLSNILPNPSEYYIADNAVPVLTEGAGVKSHTDCPPEYGTPIVTPSVTSQKELDRILAECADPNKVIEELTTIERNLITFVEGSIIYNTETDRYEKYINGSWETYPIGKQDVISKRGW